MDHPVIKPSATHAARLWFHCGRCGSLFRSPASERVARRCPKCNAIPDLGRLPTAAPSTRHSTSSRPARSHRGRSRKSRWNRHVIWLLALGWAIVLGVIIGCAHWWWPTESLSGRATAAAHAPTVSVEDMDFINHAVPPCSGVFAGFMAAGTPENRNQFVLTPVPMSSRMAHFYSLNPLINIAPSTLHLAANAVLKLPGGNALETLWSDADNQQIEAVFREENGEWRLDWEHFARYGDYPWPLFLAGSGPAEGEFRLLARERLADERKSLDTFSLVLYAPRFGQPTALGVPSPEFLVARTSADGQLLDAAFNLARSGHQVFGSKLPPLNPEGMIRVRVKVRRLEVNQHRAFEIVRIAACHWYAVDEPGVMPASAPLPTPAHH